MKRILLVDDEPMILRIMRLALAADGYDLSVAANGEDALSQIERNCPDLLITDIEMPRMSGKQLCMHLQETMPDRKFPIFVSTSLAGLEHSEWSRHIHNLTFLEKPISVRKLRLLISTAFETEESIAAGVGP